MKLQMKGDGTMTKSTMLFSSPRFLTGMSTVLDIGNTLTMYNVSDTPELADYKAMRSDWEAVGEDLIDAADRWECMNEKEV